jgi:hypothetical protein
MTVDRCEHEIPNSREQVKFLPFPVSGDIGYRFFCKKCNSWLVCECKKDVYMKYLPHYLMKFKEANQRILFAPNVCEACRNLFLDAKKRREQFIKTIEYIYNNDKEFFEYCYGDPCGYAKDIQIRHEKNGSMEAIEAEVRMEKAKRLIKDFLFKTEFD